ncbi:MAG: D-aminoacyl-tRNA deacylase [Candidatus Micrarchaeia archaeon]
MSGSSSKGIVIVYSELDPAGVNIAMHLQDSELELFKVCSDIVNCDLEIVGIGARRIFFVSRHRSEAGQSCFTVHPIGNWKEAEKGGRDSTICQSLPIEMKQTLININSHANTQLFKNKGWKVSMEVTHHGPFCEVPCFFAEIGSSEKEWTNKDAGRIVADAIINTVDFMKARNLGENWRVCFGAGGGHYAPKFNKYILDGSVLGLAFSHVLPDYYAEAIDFSTFRQGVENASPQASLVFIDWKGLKKAGRERITDFSSRLGIRIERA